MALLVVTQTWANKLAVSSRAYEFVSVVRNCCKLLLPCSMPPNRGGLHTYLVPGLPSKTLNQLNSLAAKGNVEEAMGIFRKLQADSSQQVPRFLWNAILKACANAGDFARARGVFGEMARMQVDPNQQTFGKMIEASAKAGEEREAKYWFELLKSRGFTPDHIHYTAMIDAAAKNGNADAAQGWLTTMRSACLVPSEITYASLVNAAAKKGDPNLAERLLSSMQGDKIKPDVICYTALLIAYAKVGDTQGLLRCFDTMSSSQMQLDNPVFSVMIDAFAKAGKLSDARIWFSRMQQTKLKPDIRSYGALINGYAQLRSSFDSWKKAQSVFVEMEQNSINATVVQYNQVLKAYGNSQPPRKAEAVQLFERMMSRRIEPDRLSLNYMCNVVGRPQTETLCEKACVDFEEVMHDRKLNIGMKKRLLSLDWQSVQKKEGNRRKLW
mmetsp:Transcript_54396/g.156412  ORF Transcript_54396/g.156412 Transcript_54396/m.156412 type:complete len:440 (-) Transcript_54396:93-1412(-)